VEPGEFRGRIGRYHHDSEPWWPDEPRAPAGAPNILLVVLDDVGFAQLGCFGSDIDTPTFDGLAAEGLRFSNFHTTALCSPTRAAVLTGRNHHAVGMGRITDLATGFPGYSGRIPPSCGMLPAMLAPAGYATWAVGKWHLTPEAEVHSAASRARWPLARGFERFYGFFEGETHQFAPALAADNHLVEPPASIADGYHLTEDLADQAIRLVRDLRAVDVDKPFFCWLATGACHSPHQPPPAWLEAYRGRFDAGWDAWREATLARQVALGVLPEGTRLSPRPDWVPGWDELTADEQRLYARYMEAFAGFLAHADHCVGRVLAALEETGDRERTLVVVLSDNGASSEGGPTGSINDNRPWNLTARPRAEAIARLDEIGGPNLHNNYPWGWTVAGNTPFKRWKREVHEGGVADPLIVSWPAGIAARGEVRTQYVHAIDVAPTILEIVGVEPPARIAGVEQRPLDGTSFRYALDDAGAPPRHTVQYYEMFGCRALYQDGWKAVTYHPMQSDEPGLDAATWELYDVRVDPTELDDLAAAEPQRLAAMIERWWAEAEANQVLPVDNRAFSAFVLERPPAVPPRSRYVYRPGTSPVPEAVAVNVRNRSHTITASVVVGDGGAEGVLVSLGSRLGGWTFFVAGGELRYEHNRVGAEAHRIAGAAALPPGPHDLSFRFTRTGEHAGVGTLSVDGAVVGEGEMPRFTPTRFTLTGAGLVCGADPGLSVSPDYEPPFPFTGELRQVVIEVDGEVHLDPEAEAEHAVTTQ
jgi:arylsulfatase A-like enzyme